MIDRYLFFANDIFKSKIKYCNIINPDLRTPKHKKEYILIKPNQRNHRVYIAI